MRPIRLLMVILSVSWVAAGSAPADLQDGLVAYYQFEGDLKDASGSGHDAQPSGGVPARFVEGFLGQAVDTSQTAVDCGTWDPADENTDAFSASCWVYWLGLQGAATRWQGILAKRTGWGAGLSRWQLELGDGSATAYLVNQPNGGAGSVTLTQDEWQHIAISFDGSTVAIYLDGERVGGGSWRLDNDTDATLCIGMSQATNANNFNGYIDEVAFWNRGLLQDEIALVYNSGEGQSITGPPVTATEPSPANGALDVPREAALSWTPGESAVSHNVYFGTSRDDVSNASPDAPMGVLISESQDVNSFDPEGLLDFGQTYYWRVDEVNAPPDSTVLGGDVWSFTVEPYVYPIRNIIATASSSAAGADPADTINGSGLDADDRHSMARSDMWQSAIGGPEPIWIQYEFDQAYKLTEMWVWNYNAQYENWVGIGFKDVMIEYSLDGVEWTVLGNYEFTKGPGADGYAHDTTISLQGVTAQYIRLTANSPWGTTIPQSGLSEVRFYHLPVHAREPHPSNGATDVNVDAALRWRPGREAGAHEVYFSTDILPVADMTALLASITETSYAPGPLNYGTRYYWQIVEVNNTKTPATWESGIWDFTTTEYMIVENFESYTDDMDAGQAVFQTWIDGLENGTGSVAGYFESANGTFNETRIVHDGAQSMPLQYNNGDPPYYSEVERDLGGVNFDTNGADVLRLFVAGQAPAFLEGTDGTILMNAIGADIWGVADEFRYVYKALTGDGSMVARVDDLDAAPSGWAKAGAMVRRTTNAASAHTMMVLTGGDGNGASWQGRLTDNASSESEDATDVVEPPYWIKVERVGHDFSGFVSPDGNKWTQIGTARTVTMNDPVLIGLALTSHNANRATSAQFSSISFTGNVSGTWQIAEIGATQPGGNDLAPLYVALEDDSGVVAVVTNPDSAAVGRSAWTEWLIPYTEFSGINLNSVRTMYIGVGDRNDPASGGTGTIFIDDIGCGHPATAE